MGRAALRTPSEFGVALKFDHSLSQLFSEVFVHPFSAAVSALTFVTVLEDCCDNCETAGFATYLSPSPTSLSTAALLEELRQKYL